MRSPFETVFDADDSWIYQDEDSYMSYTSHDVEDPTSDDDYIELRTDPNAYAFLTAAEYSIVDRRFGLNGDAESMKQIAADLGITHSQAREVLGSALGKMRTNMKS
ncbi:MAG: hypothetical protein U0R17_02750 [Acidimicrobiia bacterium]